MIIFDTNAYRSLVHGLSPREAEKVVMGLRRAEEKSHQQGIASPYVMLELLANLADPADGGFADCLSGVCALQRHCELDENVGQLGMLGDVESHLARGLFGVTPADNQEVTQGLAWTCLSVQRNPTSEGVKSILPRLLKLRTWVDTLEQTFIEDFRKFVVRSLDPSATDWRPLKSDSAARRRALQFLESEDALLDLASIYVLRAALKAGVSALSREELNEKARQAVAWFTTPLQLYCEIVRRIVMSGCDLTKKNRGNWLWDIQIIFSVGTQGHTVSSKPLRLATDDQDILLAARKVGAGGSVVTLADYMTGLGITAQPSVSTRNSSGASASAVR